MTTGLGYDAKGGDSNLAADSYLQAKALLSHSIDIQHRSPDIVAILKMVVNTLELRVKECRSENLDRSDLDASPAKDPSTSPALKKEPWLNIANPTSLDGYFEF